MNNRSAYGALQPTFDPEPDPRAMVFGLQARFTLLTSRLICIDAEHNSPVAYNPDAETLTLALELEPADAHLLHINRGQADVLSGLLASAALKPDEQKWL